ncbi:MAG TPA: hypothetical protein VFW95_08405 [Candidatus Limnocylindria bacterium]|nr:hypothetical protein [Candidatus Limnocylindria bacterium]
MGMGDYGPASALVYRLVDRAETLTLEESADLFRARSARTLISGADAERRALGRAERAARITGRTEAYHEAREAAAAAFRRARTGSIGPWLTVSGAVSNAAGALVVEDTLESKPFDLLFGPWQQALGRLVPTGPGSAFVEPAKDPRRRTSGILR